jgi:hypothetical protein
LTTLKNLMATPNPENPLEADIGTQYTNDRAAFIKTAKEWTKKHGTIVCLLSRSLAFSSRFLCSWWQVIVIARNIAHLPPTVDQPLNKPHTTQKDDL